MKSTSSSALLQFAVSLAVATATLVSSASSLAEFSCPTPPYGSCGSNSSTTCCPTGFYCQPWDAGFFQCIAPPAKCSQQFTNIDFYGNDSKAVYGIQPEACCDECTKTAGCTSYTFINSAPGSPACYLKSGSPSDRRPLIGAVSGIVNGGSTVTPTMAPTSAPTMAPTSAPTMAPTSAPTTAPPTVAPTTAPPTSTPTPSPTNSCATAPFGSCGSNAGVTCCPTGQYCQPWNIGFYQCVMPPAKCSQQLTNMDFYGNDIKTVYVSLPSLCCDECAKTAGCKAYTYINSAPGQPVCYLKSAAGTPTPLVGAVAGKLN